MCDVFTDSPDNVFEIDRRLTEFLPTNNIAPLRQIIYEPEIQQSTQRKATQNIGDLIIEEVDEEQEDEELQWHS